MSVIQTLRDKYATLVVIVVCISLVAFLLMDAFVGPKSFFHQSTEVVVVNGEGLQQREFMNEVQNLENMYRASNPDANITEDVRHQLRQQVWNKFVQEKLLGAEYEELGIGFPDAELRDLTVTMNAAPQIKSIPGFQNPQTGEFDPNRVATFWQNLRNAPAGNRQVALQRQQWTQLLEAVRNSALARKFTSLIMQGLYIPSWLAKEKQKENSAFANISFVSTSYTTIPDSAVNITTGELQDYLDSHQKMFQQEASVDIEYVSFDAIPSSKDSTAILKRIHELKSQLDTLSSDEIPGFISRNSETDFYPGYIPGSMIQSEEKDSILSLQKGEIYGPYYQNGLVAYAKMLDKKTIPDTVKAQQLFLSTQQISDSTAKQKIDSIENAIRGGANFAAMVNQFSQGSRQNGGELIITPGNPNMPPEITGFVYNHKEGDMGVVKSQYGYHLIHIESQKNFEEGYKIAYLTQSMDASQATDNAIFSEANKFRGLNQSRKQFEEAAQKQGLNVQVANDVATTDYQIQNIGPARELIRWAFDAEVSDVSDVFSLGDHYVIAVVTGKKEEGPADLADVRPQVEAIVRRDKKAAMIAQNMKGNSLEAIVKSTKADDSVSIAQHIGFTTPFIPNSGFEPKVVGAAFNPQLKGGKLSKSIYGNNGVYVLKVDSITTQKTDSAGLKQIIDQQNMMLDRQVASQLMNVLKKEADIEDNRLKFF